MGFLLLLGRAHRRRCSAALGTAGRRRRFGNIAGLGASSSLLEECHFTAGRAFFLSVVFFSLSSVFFLSSFLVSWAGGSALAAGILKPAGLQIFPGSSARLKGAPSGRFAAPGHFTQGVVVVITNPDCAGQVGEKAHKPGIPVSTGGTGWPAAGRSCSPQGFASGHIPETPYSAGQVTG